MVGRDRRARRIYVRNCKAFFAAHTSQEPIGFIPQSAVLKSFPTFSRNELPNVAEYISERPEMTSQLNE